MIIISPSGNLYGSEQVLIDFLENSQEKYIVYVPVRSPLFNKLMSSKTHNIYPYNLKQLKLLYIKIFFRLLFNKKQNIYINEAGHIRYIKLFARFFTYKNFFVHIRIIEDTNKKRLGTLPVNIKLITVSDFMKSKLDGYKCEMLYDPYPFSENNFNNNTVNNPFRIGIVGRITKTKGFDLIESFISEINKSTYKEDFCFNFYGDINDDAKNSFNNLLSNNLNLEYHGFVADKNKIYKNIDILLHFNTNESLGRIILEALDFNKPFICSNGGGTGEIVKLLELNESGISFGLDNWQSELLRKLIDIKNNYKHYVDLVKQAKLRAKNIFSVHNYVNKLERFFAV